MFGCSSRMCSKEWTSSVKAKNREMEEWVSISRNRRIVVENGSTN